MTLPSDMSDLLTCFDYFALTPMEVIFCVNRAERAGTEKATKIT